MSAARALPRVIFIGESGVGKTALIYRCKQHRFDATPAPTVGAAITEMEMAVGAKRVRFQFWDTAGQEIYRNIVPVYFRGISGAILVFSMTERQSFLNLEDWLQQLLSHADEDVGVLICGNKIDSDAIVVDQAEAERWANEHRHTIMFTSALTGENVDRMIEFVATTFLGPVHAEPADTGVDIAPREEAGGCC